MIYVYKKKHPRLAYYSAVCSCGWFVDTVDAHYPDSACEQKMAAAARAHDPDADTTVSFPIDQPPLRS